MPPLHYLIFPFAVVLWWDDPDAGKRDSQEGALIRYRVSYALGSVNSTNWITVDWTTNNTYTVYKDAYATAQFFRVEKVGCCLERWDEWQVSQSEYNQNQKNKRK